jgi:hypothetical protein
MKKLLFIIYFSLPLGMGWGWAFAQNLVPNPSFEDTVMCPTAGGQVAFAEHWEVYRSTPDYFNSCASVWQFSVPGNTVGFQEAATGMAYMGGCTYADILYREFFGVQLSTPLTANSVYYYEFKIVSSRRFNYGKVANNKLGIKFLNQPYTFDNPEPINGSQSFSNTIIQDTLNWIRVSGHFVADSNYTHISLGNHFDDNNTDTIQVVHNGLIAYYYFDDVCISTDSVSCSESFVTAIEQHSLSPDVSMYNSILLIKKGYYAINQLSIIDTMGKLVYQSTKPPNEIDLSNLNLNNSMYYAIIETAKSNFNLKIINQ